MHIVGVDPSFGKVRDGARQASEAGILGCGQGLSERPNLDIVDEDFGAMEGLEGDPSLEQGLFIGQVQLEHAVYQHLQVSCKALDLHRVPGVQTIGIPIIHHVSEVIPNLLG